MIFNALDSGTLLHWLLFDSVASFPLACGLSIVFAWLLYAKQK